MADGARRPRGGQSRKSLAEGSAARRRLLWAFVGAIVYTIAYLAAKHFVGF